MSWESLGPNLHMEQSKPRWNHSRLLQKWVPLLTLRTLVKQCLTVDPRLHLMKQERNQSAKYDFARSNLNAEGICSGTKNCTGKSD